MKYRAVSRPSSTFLGSIYFSFPPIRGLVSRDEQLWFPDVMESPVRLASFTVNDQRATGLLAFWSRCLRSIHTIYSEERSVAAHEAYTNVDGVWIYFPLDDGELVTKLCRRPFFNAEFPPSTTLVGCTLSTSSHANENKSNCSARLRRTEGESSGSDRNCLTTPLRDLFTPKQIRLTNLLYTRK